MFIRGMIPLRNACAFTLLSRRLFILNIYRWHLFNLRITMMHNMLRCITYSWFSCRYV
jgi:hypothetical protein